VCIGIARPPRRERAIESQGGPVGRKGSPVDAIRRGEKAARRIPGNGRADSIPPRRARAADENGGKFICLDLEMDEPSRNGEDKKSRLSRGINMFNFVFKNNGFMDMFHVEEDGRVFVGAKEAEEVTVQCIVCGEKYCYFPKTCIDPRTNCECGGKLKEVERALVTLGFYLDNEDETKRADC